MEAHERVLGHQGPAIRDVQGIRKLPVCRVRKGPRREESPRRLPDVASRLLRQGRRRGRKAARLLELRGLVQIGYDYSPRIWLGLVVRDGGGEIALDGADGSFILETDSAGERASLPFLERLCNLDQVFDMLKDYRVGWLSNKRRADGLPQVLKARLVYLGSELVGKRQEDGV